MTALSFDETGVDVVYEGTEFRMEKDLIEEATQKSYHDVTDHEVLQLIEERPNYPANPHESVIFSARPDSTSRFVIIQVKNEALIYIPNRRVNGVRGTLFQRVVGGHPLFETTT